jgi:pimeloyl-ACP methyl ester carboxylesterase
MWLMSWLGYLNGSSHVIGLLVGFAGSQTRSQLDLATRYNPLAWPGVQARETLAMLRYDATEVLSSISVPTRIFTGHLDRLIVPETARFRSERVLHAQLVRLEPAGHMPVFECHEQLVSELAMFADAVLTAAGRPAPAREAPAAVGRRFGNGVAVGGGEQDP